MTEATTTLTRAGITGASELVLARITEDFIHAHQAHWECLGRESSKVPRCMALAKLGPIDADYCEEAVALCKVNGTFERMDQADERHFKWGRLAGLLRLVVLVFIVSLTAWFGLTYIIRRISRSSGIDSAPDRSRH